MTHDREKATLELTVGSTQGDRPQRDIAVERSALRKSYVTCFKCLCVNKMLTWLSIHYVTYQKRGVARNLHLCISSQSRSLLLHP